MKDNNIIQLIWNELDSADSILFCGHSQPDGDSIGCVTALLNYFSEKGGKKTAGFLPDPVPERYKFIHGSEKIISRPDELSAFDLLVVVDCSDKDRFQPLLPLLSDEIKIINIDHHCTNTNYGNLNWVDDRAAAAGEMVLKLLSAQENRLSINVANPLYLAISTDTGSFKFSNTTPDTLRAGASLIEMGVDPAYISEHIYDNRTMGATCLLGTAISTLETAAGGKIAWMWVTREMIKKCGATEEDLEGVVNYAVNIVGVEVGMLFRENKDKEIKVAFRSRGTIDVSKLAAEIGGGGHERASGCLLHMEGKEAITFILQRIKSVMAGV